MCHDHVTTVNFCYLPFFHPLLEGKGIVGSTLISEMQAPWSMRIQYINSRYDVVIMQGVLNLFHLQVRTRVTSGLGLHYSMYYCPPRWRPGNCCYGNGPVNYFRAKPLWSLTLLTDQFFHYFVLYYHDGYIVNTYIFLGITVRLSWSTDSGGLQCLQCWTSGWPTCTMVLAVSLQWVSRGDSRWLPSITLSLYRPFDFSPT